MITITKKEGRNIDKIISAGKRAVGFRNFSSKTIVPTHKNATPVPLSTNPVEALEIDFDLAQFDAKGLAKLKKFFKKEAAFDKVINQVKKEINQLLDNRDQHLGYLKSLYALSNRSDRSGSQRRKMKKIRVHITKANSQIELGILTLKELIAKQKTK